jgi:UDP-sulfoquinovose synthase
MNIIILGGDGYLGWPTAMRLASKGHSVMAVDNYLRKILAKDTNSEALLDTPNLHIKAKIFEEMTGNHIDVMEGDCCDTNFLCGIFENFRPDTIIHYAEQPSAPYSMQNFDQAKLTLENNIGTTFSVIRAICEKAPDCHLIKLGTMGEYGTPNIDIEEGYLEVTHKGRKQNFLYPRQASSLYHTTKILDTDLIYFYVRTYGLKVTDLMQGPVYGIETQESNIHSQLYPHFHYDDIFGTVVNRFLAQAAIGFPLTVYGAGGQTRGYLNILDTLQCIELAADNPPAVGELRIFNQFTELLSVNEIADKVVEAGKRIGIVVGKKSVENPRKEMEDHYYNAKNSGLIEMGLKPHYMSAENLGQMMEFLLRNKEKIDTSKILPRVRWS